MFGVSGEHLIILAIILLIFGPRRLPQAGHAVGKAIRNFKDSFSGIKEPEFRRLDENTKHDAEAQTSQSENTETSDQSRDNA